jgi:hypothetical protein
MSLMKSLMVLQAEILDAGGIKTVCKATTWLLLILTSISLGLNPTRQAMEILGLARVLPNLIQL